MRLNAEQRIFVRETVTALAGMSASVYVFGSRLSDDARGGDLDLLIETSARLSLLQRARIKLSLEAHLGMPVDIISAQQNGPRTAFQDIARMQGVLL